MKKTIAIAAVITTIGLAGLTQAYAWGPRGGGNYGNCPQFTGSQYSQVDPAMQEKFDKFFTDTQALRKEIAMKRAEKQALMRAATPDPTAVSKVTGELFDLRAAMRQKADEAGVSNFVGPMNGRGDGTGMWGGSGRGGRFMDNGMGSRGHMGGRSW